MHVTSIDVEKAFPSVSHFAIFRALESRGFPNDFIMFVENMYNKSTTILEVNDESSQNIVVKRGVQTRGPTILSNILYRGGRSTKGNS